MTGDVVVAVAVPSSVCDGATTAMGGRGAVSGDECACVYVWRRWRMYVRMRVRAACGDGVRACGAGATIGDDDGMVRCPGDRRWAGGAMMMSDRLGETTTMAGGRDVRR